MIRRQFLLAAGCDQMQGFLFSPALAPRDIERLLGTRRAPGRSTTDHRFTDAPLEVPVGDLLHALCTNEEISTTDEAKIAHVLDCLDPEESAITATTEHSPNRAPCRGELVTRMSASTVLHAASEPYVSHRQSLREVWDDYKSTGSSHARDLLVLEYAPYAKRVADHLARRVPPNVDRSDLVSWGILGLIDALEKFDPTRGIKFESYAVTRIRGAIVDALRSEDWIPRSVRRDTRAVNDARSRLEHELRRTPSRAEVASELRTSERHVNRTLADADRGHVAPLERHWDSTI